MINTHAVNTHTHHCIKCGVTEVCENDNSYGCVHFPTLYCESCIDREIAISTEQQIIEDLDRAIEENTRLVEQLAKLNTELKALVGRPCPF